MKIILNKTRFPHYRYTLIRDGRGMGGAGEPVGHYSHEWVIANGRDCGRGYQGYMSVDYALSPENASYITEAMRAIIRKHTGAK